MAATKEQYRAALDVVHEVLPLQLQKQDKKTGEWKNIGSCVRGQDAASAALRSYKERDPNTPIRVLPKNEADKYREGFLAGSSAIEKKYSHLIDNL